MNIWRRHFVTKILKFYPYAWRAEYGEELRSMLLEQPLTFRIAGDVIAHAVRENLRKPDTWKIALLALVVCRGLWIVWHPTAPSAAGWEWFARIDGGLILLTAFITALWTGAEEGDFSHSATVGYWAAFLGDFLSQVVSFTVAGSDATGLSHTFYEPMDHFWRFLWIVAAAIGGAAAGRARHHLGSTDFSL